MYTTKKEIFAQGDALQKTYTYLADSEEKIRNLFQSNPTKKIVFIGCGSSYMLSKGAAFLFNLRSDRKAIALTGGEILIRPEEYVEIVDGALLVITSRSGETSEVLLALEKLDHLASFHALHIIASKNTSLGKRKGLTLELPWIFDESVCQTRTITNFYSILVYIFSIIHPSVSLRKCMDQVIAQQTEFIVKTSDLCSKIAGIPWSNVTVLADAELCGIAQEGALAFTEIAMLPGDYYRTLDYRHGPIVLANSNKLVIIVIQDEPGSYQTDLIKDIRKRGATVVAIGGNETLISEANYYITLTGHTDYVATGVPFIAICQLLAYYKAIEQGHNPDHPTGLDPYISL